jgi:hypothetical protein
MTQRPEVLSDAVLSAVAADQAALVASYDPAVEVVVMEAHSGEMHVVALVG